MGKIQNRIRIVYDRIRIGNVWYTIGFISFQNRLRVIYDRKRIVYDCCTIGFDPFQNRIRLVYDCIRLAYGRYTAGFDSGQVFKTFKKAADPRGGARPRGGIAKI